MNRLNKICAIFCAAFFLTSYPVVCFSGAPVKLRHIVSIYADDHGAALKHPEGVACNENEWIVVADTGNGRLLRYHFKDHVLETGSLEFKIPQLSAPVKTYINSKGKIYALDGRQRRIVRLSADGVFEGYLDPTGVPAPAAYVPKSFTISPDDNIYLLDILFGRVLVLNPEGQYLRHVEFPQDYSFFSDLTVDFKENILIVDSINARVFSANKSSTKFSPLTESLKQYVRFPTGIIADQRGRIYLLDRNGSSIAVLGQDGAFLGRLSEQGWKERLLNHPSQMCINGKGEIFIADTSNSRIQIFSTVE